MSGPRSIGTRAETGVVRYLQTHGWPYAERRALHGGADQGDITGTPGICWEVKGGKVAERASDADIRRWILETQEETANAHADLGVLVTKRAGYSAARADAWAAHLDLGAWWGLTRARLTLPLDLVAAPVRLRLSTLLPLLWADGYGIAPTGEQAVA